jgi:hypothetical protein
MVMVSQIGVWIGVSDERLGPFRKHRYRSRFTQDHQARPSLVSSPRLTSLALETTSKLVALFQSTGMITVVARKIEFVESNPFTDPHFRKRFTALLLEAREAGEPIQGL